MAIGFGVTDSGLSIAANIARLAAVAVAVINTKAAIDIAKDQEEIARDYLRISQEQQDYYMTTYAPCEDAEVREACATPEYTPHYDTTIGRAVVTARAIASGQLRKAITCFDRYNTGHNASIVKDSLLAEATAVATAANLGRRIEEDYKEAKDDLRWARRSQALARGRDMMAQSVSLSSFAFGLYGNLGAQAAHGASGALEYLGYSFNRKELDTGRRGAPIVESVGTPVRQQPVVDYEAQRQQNMIRVQSQIDKSIKGGGDTSRIFRK